ncbi:AAA family ATPase [Simiduia sp. 21SJ11W-1]|uniref:bifunctional aminoglycoside phosphotransferase/ATP-binding protein n=1 Tax=Simiduia sp. 21SJ11W-1 TaxID=2909669 RepID=UPI0020A221DB|nr:bifunctional aminoglycoside phosphotransferase/ATP-binding protein [Simiduia sp. 21SJ11W-1]UTA48265.1 AAA family ATPase [Simiduia sp. 21SJ11W-1]
MQAESIQALMRPEAFDHPVANLQLIETHISWVILTGEYAYKIKKPLDLGFLDFSSLAKRRGFCEEEIRLNQRFAPEIYLGLVAVTGTEAAPSLAQAGAHPLDYAVKMRQFDQDQLLDAIYQRGELNNALIRAIGQQLADTYAGLPALFPEDGPGTPGTLKAAIDQNFEQIGAYPLPDAERAQLNALAEATCNACERLEGKMNQRLRDGFVKDLHGDLHLGNIALVNGKIRFFDCIEFNPGFRIMDTVAEIAFITMDMIARGATTEARRLLNSYLEYSGDYQSLALLDLYRCYYATVRAKVTLMQFSPQDHALLNAPAFNTFRHYLTQALSYTVPTRPSLNLMHGVSGTGKSTLAQTLCDHTGAIAIRSDVERKRLFNLRPEQASAPGQNIYSAEANTNTLNQLVAQAQKVLDAGFSCILDATFLRASDRAPALALASNTATPVRIINCQAPENIIRERLANRKAEGIDASEADEAVMAQQLAHYEPLTEQEQAITLVADTTQPPALLAEQLRLP